MIKIEIKSLELRQVPFTYKNGQNAGKPGVMYKQEAWATTFGPDENPQPYPQRISVDIDVERDQKPWPVGEYALAPSTIYVGKYGDLQLGRVRLIPLVAGIKKAA